MTRRHSVYAAVAFAVLLTAWGGADVSAVDPSSPIEAERRTSEAPSTTISQPPTSPTSAVTTTTTTSTTTTTTTLPPITLGFAGDTSFTHGLDGRDPLGGIAEELSKPDVMIVNLETTVAEGGVGKAIAKRFTFKSPPVTGKILFDAGVDVAALANNHALDYGPEAVIRTIEILREAGVATAGTGSTLAEAYTALRLKVAGWDLAILSFSRVPCDSPEPGESYIDEVAWACPQFVDLTLAAVEAASDADFTIVMIHWGIQRDLCPAAHQRDLSTAWIEAGADAVIGSHPHVLQGVEKIGGAWVVHSTGNFAFPSARNESSYSSIFKMTITSQDERLEVFPVRIESGRPVPAGASRDGILKMLTDRSIGYTFDESGEAIPTPGTGNC
jgi:poly-gamma-glutamate capsule biosynthesis protein CapA/YwtB (metallophosphatase superfamily)